MFASRMLIGLNLTICQIEISRLAMVLRARAEISFCKWCPVVRVFANTLGNHLKINKNIEIRLDGTEKRFAMGTKFFIAVGVSPVQLLAYQVSMVSALT